MEFLNKSDDWLLIATADEPEAFGVFYARHEQDVLRFFLKRGCRSDVAVDLTAETFAAALVASRRFRPGPQPATAWVFGIARHVLAQSRRRGRVEDRARRRLAMPRLELTDELLARVDELLSSDTDGRALTFVQELPDAQREAVSARVVDEKSYDEIARELGCSEAVIRKRVSRGLKTVRERLEMPWTP